MGYALRKGVTFCIASRKVVLFDLPNCRYSGLPEATDMAFQALVESQEAADADTSALQPLIDTGLLILLENRPTRLNAQSGLGASGSLLNCRPAPVEPSLIFAALTAQISTALDLKVQPLANIFSHVQRRRTCLENAIQPMPAVDLARVVAAFVWSRRLISSGDKCLRRSIALANHLIGCGIDCRIVIGVRMRPFAAHAWVQKDDLVLDESLEEVRRYSTILVV